MPKIDQIKNDIRHEIQNLNKLLSELNDVEDDGTIRTRRVIGSILHDSYNCCERIFRLIVGEINGAVPFGFEWHRQLLSKVTHGIEKLRPPVITEQMAADLSEYLEFRHVFRNIYGFELLGDRLIRLKARYLAVFETFIKEIETFLDKMKNNTKQ